MLQLLLAKYNQRYEVHTFCLRVHMKVIGDNFYKVCVQKTLHRNQICGENSALLRTA